MPSTARISLKVRASPSTTIPWSLADISKNLSARMAAARTGATLECATMATRTTSTAELTGWVTFLRAHAAITRELSAELQREHGLTLHDYEVLLHLARADGGMMRRVDLSKSVLLSASGITRLLEGLERAGLVEKETGQSD